MDITILLQLGLLLLAAKLLGLLAKKIHIPQVIGQILAGVLLGPSVLGWVGQSDILSTLAEIGVIMLMYYAGLGTNLKQLLKSGVKALVIACVGVFVPLAGGFLLYSCYYGFAPFGDEKFFTALFIGVILTATSVSITVATLQELGKLKSEIGTTIVSAAIIDDVIGMIVLAFATGLKSPGTNLGFIVIKTVIYFVLAVALGFGVHFLFKFLQKKFPHTRRLPILGLAFCFLMAFVSEKYFGIADITGAYIAGVILCSNKEADYMAERVDETSYMIFGPIFFASIGIKTQFSGMDASLWIFAILFVIVALLTKIIGCGFASKLLGYKLKESLQIGLGMMTRGEVALIISQKALSLGVMDSKYFTAVILLILTSSVLTPLCLKLAFREKGTNAVQTQ